MTLLNYNIMTLHLDKILVYQNMKRNYKNETIGRQNYWKHFVGLALIFYLNFRLGSLNKWVRLLDKAQGDFGLTSPGFWAWAKWARENMYSRVGRFWKMNNLIKSRPKIKKMTQQNRLYRLFLQIYWVERVFILVNPYCLDV